MSSMRDTFLPFSLPTIGEEEIAEVVDSLRSGWITTGSKTKQFEEEFHVKYVVKYVPGPVGVRALNFSKARIKSLGWEAKVSLREGIKRTYAWIEAQVRAARTTS
jgi:nucleoside-diphosphate-sugar epimerase